MSPDKVAALVTSAPSVWEGVRFDHGDGWFQILLELGKELAMHGVKIGYVKEKYAVLNFHVASPSPPYGPTYLRRILDEAAEKSSHTCEECGAPGRLVYSENMYEYTRCRRHQEGMTSADESDEEDWPLGNAALQEILDLSEKDWSVEERLEAITNVARKALGVDE